jgi:hypothetical protein
MSDDALRNVHTWCGLAPDYNGISACTLTAVGILTGGKSSDATGAVRFCALAPDAELYDRCFSTLIGMGKKAFEKTKLEKFCASVPERYHAVCTQDD